MEKAIERGTAKTAMVVFGLLAVALGLGQQMDTFDFQGYVPSIIGFGIFAILAIELGLKKGMKAFAMKKFGPFQWITAFVAFLLFINAILTLPQIARSLPFVSDIAGVFYVLGGFFVVLEAMFIDSS